MTALCQQALAEIHKGDLAAASRLITEAEGAGESRFVILGLRGGIHLRRHEWAEALPYFYEARTLDDDDPLMLINIGMARYELGGFASARDAFRMSILRNSNIAKAWLKVAACCLLMQEHAEALACYERCVAMAPDDSECHQGLATILSTLGEDEAALGHYQEAQRLAGDFPDAVAGAGFTLLRMGRWLEGWRDFEARWRLPQRRVATWDYRGAPLFTGTLQDLRGRIVLLREEMGFGDTIHFSRYIPLVADVAEKVIVETSPPMRRLMETIAGVANIEFFNRSMHGIGEGMPLFYPLRDIAQKLGADVQSLQFEDVASKLYPKRKREPDWLDTAELIAGLDLVITVDTAVAHLAGSLGVPVWMMSRRDCCWRWLSEGETTAWYPGPFKIYRQRHLGEWQPVLDRVAADLREWLMR